MRERIMKALEVLNDWGPVLFGVGFLAPLIAQTMDALGMTDLFGAPPLALGLGVGVLGGIVARSRRSWV